MKKVKVKQLTNNQGNSVANHFVIHVDDKVYFQSYDSLIARWNNGQLTLGKDWDYSTTTRKYLYQFMSEFTAFYEYVGKDVEKAISDGSILYDENMK